MCLHVCVCVCVWCVWCVCVCTSSVCACVLGVCVYVCTSFVCVCVYGVCVCVCVCLRHLCACMYMVCVYGQCVCVYLICVRGVCVCVYTHTQVLRLEDVDAHLAPILKRNVSHVYVGSDSQRAMNEVLSFCISPPPPLPHVHRSRGPTTLNRRHARHAS
jgi:hypothetical protein